MNNLAILPTPSNLFRTLLTATGYRLWLENKGLDRDIDHLALEKRPGSNFDLLEHIQGQWLRAIRDDAGSDWSNLVESAWNNACFWPFSAGRHRQKTARSGRSEPERQSAPAFPLRT